MGDVGSGYLGYVIVVLAAAATRDNSVALWLCLDPLGGVFFIDATVTLLRRLLIVLRGLAARGNNPGCAQGLGSNY